MKSLFLFTITLIALFVLFLWWNYSYVPAPGRDEGEVFLNSKAKIKTEVPKTIKAMTWNIAWAYGVGSEGEGYKPQYKDYYIKRLKQMSDVLKDLSPDIVLLQEVDFNSAKSHSIDQLKWLAEEAGYAYYAPVVSWSIGYLPFPYWPPKNHFGKVVSGGGILSRFPIVSNEYELLPKPESKTLFSKLYNIFYLYRYQQRAKILVGDRSWLVLNHHLEAFDKRNRYNQLKAALDFITSHHDDVLLWGGDLNMVPSHATKKGDFAGTYSSDDYSGDKSYELITTLEGYIGWLEKASSPVEDNFTFPSDRPDRTLDYLFVKDQFSILNTRVPSYEENPSDHLPVIIDINYETESASDQDI